MGLLAALFCFGFLIFVHELGHFLVARWRGIGVEIFSIGFGRAIFKWSWRNIEWRIGWLPFGGYVRMSGMSDPTQASQKGSFFAATPFNRILVSLAGPLANFVLAFFCFCIIWFCGGVARPFSSLTQVVGYVTPQSTAFERGLRPGDRVVEAGGKRGGVIHDLFLKNQGMKGEFSLGIERGWDRSVRNMNVAIYEDYLPSFLPGSPVTLKTHPEWQHLSKAPLHGLDVADGDRVVWADGQWIYSARQLIHLVQQQAAFLVIQRGSDRMFVRIPRVVLGVSDILFNDRDQLEDWRYASGVTTPLSQCYFLPYQISDQGEVLSHLSAATQSEDLDYLERGDRVVGVGGMAVMSMADVFRQLQTSTLRVVVCRDLPSVEESSPGRGDVDDVWMRQLREMSHAPIFAELLKGRKEASWSPAWSPTFAKTLGTQGERTPSLQLLPPIELKPILDFAGTEEEKEKLHQKIEEEKRAIDAQVDPRESLIYKEHFDRLLKQASIGCLLSEQTVFYAPNPFTLFSDVSHDTLRGIASFFRIHNREDVGQMQGPLGIIHTVQKDFRINPMRGILWMGILSLNLGILNLLPMPILDGGYILFALWEIVSRKRVSVRSMFWWSVPFFILFVSLSFWITLSDIVRILY